MKPTNLTPARCVAIALLALTLLALAAPSTFAAAIAIVPALDMSDVVHDRTRLIQFSIGAVALGMGLLWWGKK